VLAATVRTARRQAITFKVTPKARNGLEPLPTRLVIPYVIVSVALSASAGYGEAHTTRAGYVFLCIFGAASFAMVATTVPVLHVVESARVADVGVPAALRTAWRPLLVGAASLLPLGVAVARFPHYVMGALEW
jgi:hypothetical protein